MHISGEDGLKVDWPAELRSKSKDEVLLHDMLENFEVDNIYFPDSRHSKPHQTVRYPTQPRESDTAKRRIDLWY